MRGLIFIIGKKSVPLFNGTLNSEVEDPYMLNSDRYTQNTFPVVHPEGFWRSSAILSRFYCYNFNIIFNRFKTHIHIIENNLCKILIIFHKLKFRANIRKPVSCIYC